MSPSSLANTTTTAREALDEWNRGRRRRRAFQRAMTGLVRGQLWRYVFVTLTSSTDAPTDIQRSWRRFHERMRRRGMAKRYIKVTERGSKTGMVHIHLIVDARWIPQDWISEQWAEIHRSPVVDIRRARTRTKVKSGKVGLALELGNYLAKDPINRLSYSHTWAFPALAKEWASWTKFGRALNVPFWIVCKVWSNFATAGLPPPEALNPRLHVVSVIAQAHGYRLSWA